MCGIVGAVANRDISDILIEGLKRLEYRGYDSAGVALLDQGKLSIRKEVGKVAALEQALTSKQTGHTGIAHTRWATHGKPTELNAHPHFSGAKLAVVHNGIIENHEALREELSSQGYQFVSETDTETIAHLINHLMQQGHDLLAGVKAAIPRLEGAYGLAVVHADEPDRIVCARSGSPLVLGLGFGENFLASDQLALRQVTDRFVYLDEGDIAEITRDAYAIWAHHGNTVERPV